MDNEDSPSEERPGLGTGSVDQCSAGVRLRPLSGPAAGPSPAGPSPADPAPQPPQPAPVHTPLKTTPLNAFVVATVKKSQREEIIPSRDRPEASSSTPPEEFRNILSSLTKDIKPTSTNQVMEKEQPHPYSSRLRAEHLESHRRRKVWKVLKYLLLITSSFIMICGLAFLALTVWLTLYREIPRAIVGEYATNIFLITIGLNGAHLALAAVIGIVAGVRGRFWVLLHAILAITAAALLVTNTILQHMYQGKLESESELHMMDNLERAAHGHAPSQWSWNEIQSKFQCCGIYRFTDWCPQNYNSSNLLTIRKHLNAKTIELTEETTGRDGPRQAARQERIQRKRKRKHKKKQVPDRQETIGLQKSNPRKSGMLTQSYDEENEPLSDTHLRGKSAQLDSHDTHKDHENDRHKMRAKTPLFRSLPSHHISKDDKVHEIVHQNESDEAERTKSPPGKLANNEWNSAFQNQNAYRSSDKAVPISKQMPGGDKEYDEIAQRSDLHEDDTNLEKEKNLRNKLKHEENEEVQSWNEEDDGKDVALDIGPADAFPVEKEYDFSETSTVSSVEHQIFPRNEIIEKKIEEKIIEHEISGDMRSDDNRKDQCTVPWSCCIREQRHSNCTVQPPFGNVHDAGCQKPITMLIIFSGGIYRSVNIAVTLLLLISVLLAIFMYVLEIPVKHTVALQEENVTEND